MSLLQLALSDETLFSAWQRVRENDGAPGTDGVTIERFAANLAHNVLNLRAQVLDGRYLPQPLLQVALPRPGKTPRLLAIPAVRDRLLQTAVALVLTPLLEPHFEDESFAYRPGRSVIQAVEAVIRARQDGLRWVVDADIAAFFDTIPHESLLRQLVPYLTEPSLLPLIRQWLAAPVRTPEGFEKRSQGVPQGSPLSPLLANLYLDPFDEAMQTGPDRRLVRYADDFVILCRSLEDAEMALEAAAQALAGAGLELNFDKTRITSFDHGFSYLGVRFFADGQEAEDIEAAPWLLPPHLRPRVARKPPIPWQAASPAARAGVKPAGRTAQNPTPVRKPAPQTAPPPTPAELPAPSEGSEGVLEDYAAPPLLRTLYVNEPGAYLHRLGERLFVSKDNEDLATIPLEKVDQVLLTGEGAISLGAVRYLLRRGIALIVADAAGQPLGALENRLQARVELHRLQFARADDPAFVLSAAREMVAAKIANCRLLLRRYFRVRADKDNAHDIALAELRNAALKAPDIAALRGYEGAAARRYFDGLKILLAPAWTFSSRNRQPPRDPVNALLSYGYGVLYHNLLTLIGRRGLHPHVGCLHSEQEGHAALASDLMEEFRPLVVDAVVLRLLLSGRVQPGDFEYGQPDCPVRLSDPLRRRFIEAMEEKFNSPMRCPKTGRPSDYRRLMRDQVAHWADVVLGQAERYQAVTLR